MARVNPSLIKANRNIGRAIMRGRNGVEGAVAKNLSVAASVPKAPSSRIKRWGGNFTVRNKDAAKEAPGFFSKHKGKIAMGMAALGGIAVGSEAIGRFMSEEGDLTRDRDGNRDILGVPFI